MTKMALMTRIRAIDRSYADQPLEEFTVAFLREILVGVKHRAGLRHRCRPERKLGCAYGPSPDEEAR